jgi:uncharacterized protein YbbC (DUF1343 family)
MIAKVKIFVVILILFQLNCYSSRQIVEDKPVQTEVEESKQKNERVGEEGAIKIEEEVEEEEPVWMDEQRIVVGAERIRVYLPLLAGKEVALVVNQTSMVGETHLVDTLLSLGVNVRAVFSPEHGFRGTADAGEKLKDEKDPQTGVSLLSLYGQKRKPSAEDLVGLGWVIFDIQDVGTRYYTYISTMHYVMEACAENGIPLMVLDRPNPNGHYVDGPILDLKYRSFVGMHAVPVVHAMSVGEYARMINGEGWLENGRNCELTVITCENYDHQTFYDLPVKPSPNLPNMTSIYLYPSTCLFEGTVASEGRGTDKQFQVYGHPGFPGGDYKFTPVSMPGARQPKLEGKLCRGYDLSGMPIDELRAMKKVNLSYVIDFYRDFPDKKNFFLETLFFDKLAGGDDLRKQIIVGKTEAQIRATWQEGLEKYKAMRKKYLLYPDFE